MTIPSVQELSELLDIVTPAPWRTRTLENFGFNIVHYIGGDKFNLARIAKVHEEPNARLIELAPSLALRVIALEARLADADKMAEAATALIDRKMSDFKARNGRLVGVQGDDGEKCYIVHSDQIFDLQAALTAWETRQ